MNPETFRDTLLLCAAINYALLFAWFAAFILAHDWMYRLHERWFRLTRETFDAIHYAGMALYKVGVLLLFVTPYAALSLR